MNKQNPKLIFVPLSGFQKGIVFDLLLRSYFGLLKKYKLKHRENLIDNWKKFDKDAFNNLNTIGKCVFITTIDNTIIGFGSFDPRQWPEVGIIGHNCILPEYRNQGYGRKQIQEIIKRFQENKFKSAKVSTGDHPFFLSSQKMYLSCGFKETGRIKKEDADFSQIEYELSL